jgi:hypothetical protein
MSAAHNIVLAGLALLALGVGAHADNASELSVEVAAGNRSVTINGGSPMMVEQINKEDEPRLLTTFNSGLHYMGMPARVESCAQEIDIPVGVGGGNNSYGAVCELTFPGQTRPVKVAMCADEAVGYVAIANLAPTPPTPTFPEALLINFVATNCFGG